MKYLEHGQHHRRTGRNTIGTPGCTNTRDSVVQVVSCSNTGDSVVQVVSCSNIHEKRAVDSEGAERTQAYKCVVIVHGSLCAYSIEISSNGLAPIGNAGKPAPPSLTHLSVPRINKPQGRCTLTSRWSTWTEALSFRAIRPIVTQVRRCYGGCRSQPGAPSASVCDRCSSECCIIVAAIEQVMVVVNTYSILDVV